MEEEIEDLKRTGFIAKQRRRKLRGKHFWNNRNLGNQVINAKASAKVEMRRRRFRGHIYAKAIMRELAPRTRR
jgi:hypothetical protein